MTDHQFVYPYSDTELDAMVKQYIITALWSTIGDDDEPLDESHDPDDLAPETRDAARRVCRDFADANATDIRDMDPGQCGHDLWLTREHHGVGFWDRGLGERGERLTTAADAYGSADWYVGDDGLIYGSD